MSEPSFTALRVGTWPHWRQPAYKIATRLKERLHCQVEEVDFKKAGYLDKLDVLIIEQDGYNDYIDNDQGYVQDFVRRGGVCWIMHQDCGRWTPHFFPRGLAHPILVNRYAETTGGRWEYLMPWVEDKGERLFAHPNRIVPEEMVYWETPWQAATVKSAARSCVLNTQGWEVVGSYRDAAIQEGALVLRARYGEGLFLWNQLLFPEEKIDEGRPELRFWDRYAENALCYFEAFLRKRPLNPVETTVGRLPAKACHKMIAHLHALDWYGAGSDLGTIAAAMRRLGFDIGVLGIKNADGLGGHVDLGKYCDDRVLLLPGQEFHPFNWEGGGDYNRLHILSMGVESCTDEFTRSLFSMEDAEAYLDRALAYVRDNGGASAATHPTDDYWTRHAFDAVDVPLDQGLGGSTLEKFYLGGGRITALASVDMWGVARLKEYPAFNFIYLEGEPSRGEVVAAVKAGHVMPALNIETADVSLAGHRPGDAVSLAEASTGHVDIDVVGKGSLKEIRVHSGERVIFRETLANVRAASRRVGLQGLELAGFVRVEVEGEGCMLIANPFYLEP